MPAPSKVKLLPKEIRAEVDRLLDARVATRAIVAKLRELGHGVSKSSVARYKLEFDKVASRMREAREMAAGLVASLGDAPENKMGQLVVEMMQRLIFDALLKADEDGGSLTPEDVMLLGKGIKDLQMGAKSIADREVVIRNKLQAEMKKKLDGLEQEAAGGKRRLDADTLRQVREIYGIAS